MNLLVNNPTARTKTLPTALIDFWQSNSAPRARWRGVPERSIKFMRSEGTPRRILARGAECLCRIRSQRRLDQVLREDRAERLRLDAEAGKAVDLADTVDEQ